MRRVLLSAGMQPNFVIGSSVGRGQRQLFPLELQTRKASKSSRISGPACADRADALSASYVFIAIHIRLAYRVKSMISSD